MKNKGKSKVKNKDLEKDITSKFMDVVHGLGHDAEKLKKEIGKAGKAISEKIGNALKATQKLKAKTEVKAAKTAKKAGKKLLEVKAEVSKADAKADKVAAEVSKAAAVKGSAISSRSVAKPAIPAITKTPEKPAEIEPVKEASAATPAKRKRAPRTKKPAAEAQPAAEKAPVKQASAPAKRKRSPNKPKPAAAKEENPDAETTGSAVL